MRRPTSYAITSSRRLPISLLVIAFAVVTPLLGACSSDASGPQDPPEQITGNYSLANVGGNRLPAAIYEGPYTVQGTTINVVIEVVSSSLRLTADRYTLDMEISLSAEGETVPFQLRDVGGYERDGSDLLFESDDAEIGTFVGSIRGGDVGVLLDIIGDRNPPAYLFRK